MTNINTKIGAINNIITKEPTTVIIAVQILIKSLDKDVLTVSISYDILLIISPV